MPTIKLGSDNFDEMVDVEGICLIDCWASWCQGCGEFAPVFKGASERHSSHTFATLDTGSEPDLTAKLRVKHIPTLVLFRDGILLFRQPGYVPAEGLDDIVEKAQRLDMDFVRAEMEKEESTPNV